MYMKDLNKTVQLRLTEDDYNFLVKIKEERRYPSISELVRFIIGDYRRGLQMWEVMKNAYETAGKVESNDQ